MINTLQQIILSVSILLLGSMAIQAQNGTIRGSVIEDASGETLIAVSVYTDNDAVGTSTDFDGTFELSVPEGVYNLSFSYISYQDIRITDVEVTAGEVTLLENIRMFSDAEQLQEVVITAEAVRSSEAALMTLKRKSTNLLDGISSAKFKKIGDSNAASAVKRVTGVSIEGGKYVYVRGLGDRYTKTMLNGLDIPGLDPDRNSLQIDIFPTNIIDNMAIYKTSLAELPADYSGGVINIETKAFPEERVFDVSFSLGYNPSMHLQSDFLTYEGGGTDFLGYDDGTRALPTAALPDENGGIPNPFTGDPDDAGRFIREFTPTLGATTTTSAPDFSIGAAYGDQIAVGKKDHKLGYTFSTSYKSSRQHFMDQAFGEYQRSIANEEYELQRSTTQEGVLSSENILLSGLAGIAYKTKSFKHRLTLMHLQNGESTAGQFTVFNDEEGVGQSGYEAASNNLEYGQRALTNAIFTTDYFNADGSWNVEFKLSPTVSSLDDPDIRKTAFTTDGGSSDFQFNAGAGGNPRRLWRELDERSIASGLNVTRETTLFGRDAKIKFGAGQVFKNRDYSILQYDLQFFGTQPTWSGDANEVLNDENLFPSGVIYYGSGNSNPNANEYNSRLSNTSGYISATLEPTPTLKATLGLRAEYFQQWHTGRDVAFATTGNGLNLNDERVLDTLDLFPSLNITQELADKQNLRFSYSRTIARPSFKELSFAQIIDPLSNRIFNGSLFPYEGDWAGNLSETRINNFDLRWELFGSNGQLFSVSGFYKTFDDPIELVRIPQAQTSNEFQPRNVGNGQLYGVEVEVRKDFSFISEVLQKLSVSTNVTIVESQIDMTELEFNARKAFEKPGEVVTDTRAMQGQAPFIINAGLLYNDIEKRFDAGIYYNVQGPTLLVVGGGLFPDVYSEPFHSVKATFNLGIGERASISFEVDNLLNDVREEFFTGFRADDQIFTRFSPGVAIGLGVSYKIY